MDYNHHWPPPPPQSPTHSSPELPPQTLTSFAQSYITTTEPQQQKPTPAQLFVQQHQQKQQHEFSIGSSTVVENNNNNNNNNNSNNSNLNNNSHINNNNNESVFNSKGSSNSSISLFESAASIDNQSIHKSKGDEEQIIEEERENKRDNSKLGDYQKEYLAGLHMLGKEPNHLYINQPSSTTINNNLNNDNNNTKSHLNQYDQYGHHHNYNQNINIQTENQTEPNEHHHYKNQNNQYQYYQENDQANSKNKNQLLYDDKLSSLNPFSTSNVYNRNYSIDNNNYYNNNNNKAITTTTTTITSMLARTNIEKEEDNNDGEDGDDYDDEIQETDDDDDDDDDNDDDDDDVENNNDNNINDHRLKFDSRPILLTQIELDEELRGYRRTPRNNNSNNNNNNNTGFIFPSSHRDDGTDDLESQTKNNGDIHDNSSINGIWHDFEPDYGMLNESYQTTKNNIYKDIELTLGNLQQLETRFETSKLQFHTKIEKEYENCSYQLDLKQQQLEYRKRNLNEKEPQNITTFQNKIKLNIGGKVFETTLATLQREQSSLLATMFSGKHTLEPCSDGSYFIDRDPTHFRLVLNYLRDLRV
ncbi:unnamed protein product [Cunninghamella blakesleeana]